MEQEHLPGQEAWLIGEHRSNGECKYYLSNLPADTSLKRLAGAIKARWICEQARQQLKEELGLDHFEGRSWAGLHRHALMTMIAFIDDHREAHGIEPICKVLPIAPSTYHACVAKRVDPSRLSARARRDAALKDEVRRVFEANFRVYGVRKVWRQLQREGFDVARCTVARLMTAMGLEGIIRGKTSAPL